MKERKVGGKRGRGEVDIQGGKTYSEDEFLVVQNPRLGAVQNS